MMKTMTMMMTTMTKTMTTSEIVLPFQQYFTRQTVMSIVTNTNIIYRLPAHLSVYR